MQRRVRAMQRTHEEQEADDGKQPGRLAERGVQRRTVAGHEVTVGGTGHWQRKQRSERRGRAQKRSERDDSEEASDEEQRSIAKGTSKDQCTETQPHRTSDRSERAQPD